MFCKAKQSFINNKIFVIFVDKYNSMTITPETIAVILKVCKEQKSMFRILVFLLKVNWATSDVIKKYMGVSKTAAVCHLIRLRNKKLITSQKVRAHSTGRKFCKHSITDEGIAYVINIVTEINDNIHIPEDITIPYR